MQSTHIAYTEIRLLSERESDRHNTNSHVVDDKQKKKTKQQKQKLH